MSTVLAMPVAATEGGKVLARSAPITVVPGLARQTDQVTAGVPPQTPTATPGTIPADGMTVITIVAGPILDGILGNVVADGATVHWTVESDAGSGELLEEEATTSSGFVTAQYRAWDRAGQGDDSGDGGRRGGFSHDPAGAASGEPQEVAPYRFRLTVDSDAGKPADHTPVVWGTEYALVEWDPPSGLQRWCGHCGVA
jgi:hypothetical protein